MQGQQGLRQARVAQGGDETGGIAASAFDPAANNHCRHYVGKARENAGEAYRMYQAAFNRTPDSKGLAGWINFLDQGGEAIKMAEQFIASSEFNKTYGLLNNNAFVQLLYNNVLGRNGEESGVRGWVNALNDGMSRADVLYGFSESSENIIRVAPAISNGVNYVEWWLN